MSNCHNTWLQLNILNEELQFHNAFHHSHDKIILLLFLKPFRKSFISCRQCQVTSVELRSSEEKARR